MTQRRAVRQAIGPSGASGLPAAGRGGGVTAPVRSPRRWLQGWGWNRLFWSRAWWFRSHEGRAQIPACVPECRPFVRPAPTAPSPHGGCGAVEGRGASRGRSRSTPTSPERSHCHGGHCRPPAFTTGLPFASQTVGLSRGLAGGSCWWPTNHSRVREAVAGKGTHGCPSGRGDFGGMVPRPTRRVPCGLREKLPRAGLGLLVSRPPRRTVSGATSHLPCGVRLRVSGATPVKC